MTLGPEAMLGIKMGLLSEICTCCALEVEETHTLAYPSATIDCDFVMDLRVARNHDHHCCFRPTHGRELQKLER